MQLHFIASSRLGDTCFLLPTCLAWWNQGVYLFLRAILCQDLPQRCSRPSCSLTLTVAHPPMADPEACLVRTSDDFRLGPHHRPLSSAAVPIFLLRRMVRRIMGMGELARGDEISRSKVKSAAHG
ncbi:hypothetical protein F5883DRAFT_547379 [Diaporthe sp. PMI_573]|nr:hypothetical protein F5883DRAFT_547379 [Diaporthaceae sp. PMI_573]